MLGFTVKVLVLRGGPAQEGEKVIYTKKKRSGERIFTLQQKGRVLFTGGRSTNAPIQEGRERGLP